MILLACPALAGPVALGGGSAEAGPWIAKSEEFAIASLALGATADGGLAQESDLYLESVIAPRRLSVVARHHAVSQPEGERRELDALVKTAATLGPIAAAGAVGPIWVDAPWEGACLGHGIETRAAIGAALPKGAYVAAEAGRRDFGRGCVNLRSEATLGVTQGPWLAMAQVFHDDELGRGEASAQVSAVRFLRRGREVQIGVQVGVRARLREDRASAQAPALLVGLWARAG